MTLPSRPTGAAVHGAGVGEGGSRSPRTRDRSRIGIRSRPVAATAGCRGATGRAIAGGTGSPGPPGMACGPEAARRAGLARERAHRAGAGLRAGSG